MNTASKATMEANTSVMIHTHAEFLVFFSKMARVNQLRPAISAVLKPFASSSNSKMALRTPEFLAENCATLLSSTSSMIQSPLFSLT